jgi:hypothetical protein
MVAGTGKPFSRSFSGKRGEWLYQGLIVVFVVVAYWPLSSFSHTARWDAIDGYFPLRFFLSDCLRNGHMPFWLPYQFGGTPFYADPQSGAWYPLAWLFSVAAPYTLKSFAIEYLTTIAIGGLGIYRLVKSFNVQPAIAFIAAISFCASGFFISSAEYFSWVISAAWTPWVFWAYHRLLQTARPGYAVLAGIFFYMLLSGGYPAFIAVNGYLLILFFLLDFFSRGRTGTRGRIVALNGLMAMVFVLLSAGPLWSWYGVGDLISRGAALTLEEVNNGPFSPRCLESLLLPFVTLKGDDIYRTDISMRNAYFGLVCLSAMPFALLRATDRRLWIILILSLLCLTAAMGDYLPVRKVLFDYVPTMRLFRLPALFRLYTIIGFIVIGAVGLDAVFRDPERYKRHWIIALGFLAVVVLCLFLISVSKHGFRWNWGWRGRTFKENYYRADRSEHVQLQAMLQVSLVCALILFIRLRRNEVRLIPVVLLFCSADMIAAVGLNAFGTLVYMEPFDDLATHIRNAPRAFVIPDANIPVGAVTDSSRQFGLLRVNTSIYYKFPAFDGYNSFLLKSYKRLSESPIRRNVLRSPYVYISSIVAAESADSTIGPEQSTAVFLKKPDLDSLRSVRGSDASGTLRVERFTPNLITIAATALQPVLLNLQQAPVPGWQVRIDKQPASWFVSNINQMAVPVAAGKHEVEWRFEPKWIRYLAIECIGLLLLLTGILTGFRRTLF